eukprot:2535151-Amphidinium_carterae.1
MDRAACNGVLLQNHCKEDYYTQFETVLEVFPIQASVTSSAVVRHAVAAFLPAISKISLTVQTEEMPADY